MRRWILAVAVLAWFAGDARAFIEAPHSLGRICSEATNVVLVEVSRIDAERNLIIYKKVKDLKGEHPEPQIKHNVGKAGSHEREWQTVMAWAKVGRRAVFFHNGTASVTGIDQYWYQCFKEGNWWAMTHAEPFLLRSYYGGATELAAAVEKVLAGKEVVVPAMTVASKEQFHLRTGKVQRIRAGLKRVDYDLKRDFVADGAGDEAQAPAEKVKPAKAVVAAKDRDQVDVKAPAKGVDARQAPAAEKAAAEKVRARAPAPGLVIDKAARRVKVPCVVAPRKLAHLGQVYPIEVIATWPHPRGQKAHETVVTFDQQIKPSDVHAALKQLGLSAGKPVRGQGGKAQGPVVKLYLELPGADGKSKRVPVEQVLTVKGSGKPPAAMKWHFTGSAQRQPDPEKDEKVYGADVTGTLAALFPVTRDVVIQSDLTLGEEAEMKLETNRQVLPKEGSGVALVIEAQ